MEFKNIGVRSCFTFLLLLLSASLLAQNTIVTGTVTDARTKQTMPGVNVAIPGTTIGVTTDVNGKYAINTAKPFTQLKITFLGYRDYLLTITPGITQQLNVRLVPAVARQLQEVVVRSGKKAKYRNKDNPAVELIRKVIENKEKIFQQSTCVYE